MHYVIFEKQLDVLTTLATHPRCNLDLINRNRKNVLRALPRRLSVLFGIKCWSIASLSNTITSSDLAVLLDEHGNNALHIACSSDVDAGLKVRAILHTHPRLSSEVNCLGELPIHTAARNKQAEALNALIDDEFSSCMRLNAPNNHGQTPLHLAVQCNIHEIIFKLLQHRLTEGGRRSHALHAAGVDSSVAVVGPGRANQRTGREPWSRNERRIARLRSLAPPWSAPRRSW